MSDDKPNGHDPSERMNREDGLLVMNACFAEKFAGYQRIQTDEGLRWVKSADGDDPVRLTLEQLPTVAGSGFTFMTFLADMLKAANAQPESPGLLFAFNQQQSGQYVCVVGSMNGEAFSPHQMQSDEDPAVAIGAVMLKMVGANPKAEHRALMPHRYLVS